MEKSIKTILLLIIISVVSLVVTYVWAIEFSSFSIGIAKYTMSVMLVWTIDKFVITEVDTIRLISENPVAYSIFFFGNCLLAAACIATS